MKRSRSRSSSGRLTSQEQDSRFIGVDLHLPGDPLSIKVRVPHAVLLVVVAELVGRASEGDLEIALHRVLVLLLLLSSRRRHFLRCSTENNRDSFNTLTTLSPLQHRKQPRLIQVNTLTTLSPLQHRKQR